MTQKVYHVSDAIICNLGNDSKEVYEAVLASKSGIQLHTFDNGMQYPAAALTAQQNELLNDKYNNTFTRFEKMCLMAIDQALVNTTIDTSSKDCVFILSTTKGNVSLIANAADNDKIPLSYSANKIVQHYNNSNKAICVSIACISGVAVQVMAKRLLETCQYKHVIIVGCDELSDFVVAGFHSFQALSKELCLPFDAKRNGLNLGEAAVALVLSVDESLKSNKGILQGGAINNDANHLSGPSKTGEELGYTISQAIKEADLLPNAIGFVSAHGTATNYNDEMESKAIIMAGITCPVNSLKPHFGHTLGASGLLETVVSLYALNNDKVLPTLNFNETNVSGSITLSKQIESKPINAFVKTAAGFGGCDAAIVWSKN